MLCVFCDKKKAIKNGNAFRGLCVPRKSYWRKEFLKPEYNLLAVYDETGKDRLGYVIYETRGEDFIFHLVNFTQRRTRNMTERFVRWFVKPLCEETGLSRILARAERKGMQRKLEKIGFRNAGGNLYEGRLEHVL